MIPLALTALPVLELAGFVLVLMSATAVVAILWDVDIKLRHSASSRRDRRQLPSFLEREFDLAAGLGWRPRRWIVMRISFAILGLVIGFLSNIPLLIVVGGMTGFLGVRFALAGRAANRRLKMERAFLGQLRNLRDRMSVSNQSLDTALQEIGRSPGRELEYVLAPLARGGSVVQNIVETGVRSRSPVVEYACGVLIWARSRSLDSLIEAIDEILLPVGDAQLAVQEEALVTLTQQRAVTFAMAALMGFMFFVIDRVDIFNAYYRTTEGSIVLGVVMLIFAGLVFALGVIVRVSTWTRWDLRKLAREQERLGV